MPLPISAQIAPFVNKSVPFRFDGRDLEFCLSHGLFSSYDIDDGTRLLLKTIAQHLDLGSRRAVLDVGCGVGVIGACIAARAPGARVTLQDRDSLAAAVAQENCRRNGLPHASAECCLAFHGLRGRAFDLVTSNLPAKAGAPVLSAMLRHAAGCLGPDGMAAVVIVAPLAAFARETIARMGVPLHYAEDGAGYSVFHFSAGALPPESDREREDLSPYIRGRHSFERDGLGYSLETVYSLPDFDTLGHDLLLALDLMRERGGVDQPVEAAAFWNPGQGHLPIAVLARQGDKPSIVLAARDSLECTISARNLLAAGKQPSGTHLLSSERDLGSALSESSLDFLAALPHPIPRSPWQADLVRCARRALRPGGRLLVVASSTEMHRLLQASSGLAVIASRKREGFRAALLRKPGEAILP